VNYEDPIFSGSNMHAIEKRNMNGNQYSESRNRRELKLEKEELTALFSELISVINEKVCQVDDDYAKTPKLMI
jgi:hypothetical protein